MHTSMGRKSRGCVIKHSAGFSLLLLLAFVDLAVKAFELEECKYRLPTNVQPEHYDLTMVPVIYSADEFKYDGKVKIKMTCVSETNTITLNLNGPEVDKTSIIFHAEKSRLEANPEYVSSIEDKDCQLFIITLSSNMKVGKTYDIEMKFVTTFHNKTGGIFYTNYVESNVTKNLLATTFEPTFARTVFPCFDEPAMKATFTVTLARPSCTISRFNTERDGSLETYQESGVEYVKEVFKTTPRMSTYSLAFACLDFLKVSKKTKNGLEITMFGPGLPEKEMAYALDLAVNLTEYFENHFGVDHPLTKIDFVGVLPGFPNTANWGLNFFSHQRLQYNHTHFHDEDRLIVAKTVAYGTVHGWFGNLVTPAWWDDIWLKEGLASFYEDFAITAINRDMRSCEFFIMDKLHKALEEDASVHSSPVYKKVKAIKDILDVVEWNRDKKGPSLFRMLKFIIGPETFRKGISSYLKKFATKTATHDDLFNELNEQVKSAGLKLDVKSVMDTWILQKGYPVVTVSRDFNNNSALFVTQERFLSDPTARDTEICPASFNSRWTIPLTFTFSKNPVFEQGPSDIYWMSSDERSKLIYIKGVLSECGTNNAEWFLANVEQQGFYRVNYQPGNWLALRLQLITNYSVIPMVNRAQIINDAWHLTRASYISMDIAMSMLEYLDNEIDYVPWFTAWVEFRYLNSMLIYSNIYGAFQTFMRLKLDKPYEQLELDTFTENQTEPFLRSLITEQACYYGIESCVAMTNKQYAQLIKEPDNNTIPINLRKAIYCQAIASGGWKEWAFALELYQKAESDSARDYITFALSCSNEPWILNHFLHLLLDANATFTTARAQGVIIDVGMNPIGRYLSWDFYRVNYDLLVTKYIGLHYALFLSKLTRFFNTELELQEVIEFLSDKYPDPNDQSLRKVISDVTENIEWMTTKVPTLKLWLKTSGYLEE